VLGGGLLGLASRDPAALADHPKRARVEALERIARDSGLDAYQLAFGFVRAHGPEISTVLVGTSHADHLRRNVEALNAAPLPTDVVQALADLAPATPEVR
jgi:aryl-alcohol dehydrogenase-like predicted oxidoreductase